MKKHISENDQVSEEIVNEIGGRITSIRLSYGLKQAEFCDIIGISKGNLSDLENNRYKPSYQAIFKIVDNFNVNPHWFLSGKGEAFEKDSKSDISDDYTSLASGLRGCSNAECIIRDISVIRGISEPALKEVKDYVRFKLKTEIKKKDRRTVARRSAGHNNAVPGDSDRRNGEDRRKIFTLAWQ